MITTQATADRDVLSTEVRVALAPRATFERLVAADRDVSRWRVLAGPALALLVIAVTVPILAVQRITIGLVATVALSWSFVVVVQIIAGALLIASAPQRRVPMGRALELWFAAQLPYDLWLLTTAVVVAATGWSASLVYLLGAGLPATAWTSVIAAAYGTAVLGLPRRAARVRAAVHQIVMIGIVLGYADLTAGGWFQIVGAIRYALR